MGEQTNYPYIYLELSMTLTDFLRLDETHNLSPDDVQNLNESLAKASLSEIPPNHQQRLLDYLVNVLNIGAVNPMIICALEDLRLKLDSEKHNA